MNGIPARRREGCGDFRIWRNFVHFADFDRRLPEVAAGSWIGDKQAL